MSKKSEFDFNVFFTKFEIGDDQTLGRTCKVVDASTCILETALKPSAWLLFALGLKQNLSNKKPFKFYKFSSAFEKYRGQHFNGLNRVEGDCGGVWSHGRKSFWEGQWRIQGFDGERIHVFINAVKMQNCLSFFWLKWIYCHFIDASII